MPTTRANGIEIYYESSGSGDPVLVIGGLATDLTQMKAFVGKLAERHRVISFDNRGVGRSDKPDVPYSIDMMTEDAAGLLEAIGVSSADVVGFSLGGRIALSLSLLHPSMVKRLVLISTSPRANFYRGFRWWLSNQLQRSSLIRGWGTKYPQPYYAYVRQREASRGYDATARLKEVSQPTLILHGTKDRTVPYQMAEEAHAGIPGSRLVSFNGGHLAVFFSPVMLAGLVEEFLAPSQG